MASNREYGAAIFSPGLAEILLIKHDDGAGWSFPFGNARESDIHVVAAASAVRQLLGIDIGDKISRAHWIEIDYPQTGASVRLYMALGVRPETVSPRCVSGASARWHPLRSILPPVNAIVRTDVAGTSGHLDYGAGPDEADADTGGDLMLEAGIAPFLAKMKALLDKHPQWRISQLDPHLMRLIQDAITFPSPAVPQQAQPRPAQELPQVPSQGQDQQQCQEQPSDQPAGEDARPAAQADIPGGVAAGGGSGPGAAGCQPQVAEDGGRGAQGGPQGSDGSAQQDPAQQAERQEREQQAEHGGQEQQQLPAAGCADAEVQGGSAVVVKEAPVDASETGDGALTVEPGGQGPGPSATVSAHGAVAPAGVVGGGNPPPEDSGNAVGGGDPAGWQGPRPQEHLLAYCRLHQLPEPCYSLVVKKSARRPLVTASCILPHLGVQVTPDMHVPGGIHAACQAAALAATLWLEGALPADGGEAVRVVPVGWPPLLSEARGESWEAAQAARRAAARRELDLVQREALLREMDKKRQRLVAQAEELERLMAALRGGEVGPELDLSKLTASLGLGGGGGGGGGADEMMVLPGTIGGAAAPECADGAALAGSLAVGMKALQFRSGSGGLPTSSGQGAGSRGAGAAAGRPPGRAPGTKRPRDDGQQAAGGGAADGGAVAQQSGGAAQVKSVVMELKELCDRRRWPQPLYSYGNGPAGPGVAAGSPAGSSAMAVVTLPTVVGLGEFSSGPQSNRKRAKEAAAAAALAQLSALGLK